MFKHSNSWTILKSHVSLDLNQGLSADHILATGLHNRTAYLCICMFTQSEQKLTLLTCLYIKTDTVPKGFSFIHYMCTLARCPCMYSLLTCVEPPACRASTACHCLSSVMDVHFSAHRERERERVAELSSSVLSTQWWVPSLFREEDVISLVKNPAYVACHSWLNPGFSFVQCSPSPLLPLFLSGFFPPSLACIFLADWRQHVIDGTGDLDV